MSFTLDFLLFIKPGLYLLSAICVALILVLGVLFAIEERQAYLVSKHGANGSTRVLRTNWKLLYSQLRWKIKHQVSSRTRLKTKARKAKEDEALASGFFESDYTPGFDNTGSILRRERHVETEAASAYLKMMERLTDDKNIALFESKDI